MTGNYQDLLRNGEHLGEVVDLGRMAREIGTWTVEEGRYVTDGEYAVAEVFKLTRGGVTRFARIAYPD